MMEASEWMRALSDHPSLLFCAVHGAEFKNVWHSDLCTLDMRHDRERAAVHDIFPVLQ